MSLAVVWSVAASRMLLDAEDRWQREHGFFVDNPLSDQVAAMLRLLVEYPELGKVGRPARYVAPAIRLVVLRCGWELWYSHDAPRARIVVEAVWYPRRGGPPPI
ncbi:MAG TPA: hypothetical protein VGM88_10305 [Kofleriaceae bacterium]|jgi:hypothetical protein